MRTIGITPGDPAGIGPEVLLKSLAGLRPAPGARVVVIGNRELLEHFRRKFRLIIDWTLIGGLDRIPPRCRIALLDLPAPAGFRVRPGSGSVESAKIALLWINTCVKLVKLGQLQGIVTAPVSKEMINRAGVPFLGHTEYLAARFGVPEERLAMLMASRELRVILLTRHIPLKEVAAAIRPAAIRRAISLGRQFCRRIGIRRPRIAVCGLNPHAGDGGFIGREELALIRPAIRGLSGVSGPFPADSVFIPGNASGFDLFIAMYHDQGMIPFKNHGFGGGVNVTLGLPVLRTSPAHGTAFGIAGKGKANSPGSMREAIHLACHA